MHLEGGLCDKNVLTLPDLHGNHLIMLNSFKINQNEVTSLGTGALGEASRLKFVGLFLIPVLSLLWSHLFSLH